MLGHHTTKLRVDVKFNLEILLKMYTKFNPNLKSQMMFVPNTTQLSISLINDFGFLPLPNVISLMDIDANRCYMPNTMALLVTRKELTYFHTHD